MAEPQQASGTKTLKQLFEAEPDRLSRFTFDVAGVHFDWSKTHLDAGAMERFLERAEGMGFASARDALFAGEVVNPSEGRAATHVAERGSGAPAEVDLATARRQRMRALVDAIEAGAFGTLTGILHIGIGGSVLGPALLVDALGRRASSLNVRFLSNIDGAAFEDAVRTLDPATTLVVVASKTFSTLETLAKLVGDPALIERAQANAKRAGVESLVTFRVQDAMTVDVSDATVVTLYLLAASNVKLRPILTKTLRPGARIVAHNYPIGDWEPDDVDTFADTAGTTRTLFLWNIR